MNYPLLHRIHLLCLRSLGYYSTDSYSNLSKADSSSVQVAANETVDASDAQTIMIIQDRDGQPEYHESSLIGSEQQVREAV